MIICTSVAFSPDGRFIVSGSDDKTLKLWDAANGALLKTFKGHDGFCLLFCRLLPRRTLHRLRKQRRHPQALGRRQRRAAENLQRDNDDYVYFCCLLPRWTLHRLRERRTHTLKLWDAANGALLKTLHGGRHHEINMIYNYVSSVAFSRDGRFIASGSGDKTVKLWDAATGALLKTFKGHDAGV